MTYKAFISYSHTDEKWARWLHRSLESYRPPRDLEIEEKLRPLFRDREELAASRDLSETIEQALAESENLIVICSPNAAASRWVNAEVSRFEQLGRGARIYCLIVDGEPNSPDGECLPEALRQKEPLAADVRAHADGRTNALLKLAASLLGVSFDALRRRDARRRQRRLAGITAASLVATIGALALAYSAQVARDAAERESEKSRKITGFLVDVFKLADPAETRRSDMSAKELLLEGAAEIPTRFADEPAVLIDLSTEVGVIFESYAEFAKAESSFDQAVRYSADHYGEESLEFAAALRSLGRVYLLQDRYDESITLQRQALRIEESMLDPDDPARIEALATLGGSLVYMGDAGQEAAQLLERAQQIHERSDLPDSEDLIVVEFRLAGLYREQGRFVEAVQAYQSCLTRLERIGARPDRRAMVLAELGNSLANVDRQEEGLASYDEAISILSSLYGDEHPNLANIWLFKAHLLIETNDVAAARIAVDNTERLARLAAGPDSDLVSFALEARGRLLLREGQNREAVVLLQDLVARWTRSIGRDHVDTASAMTLLSEALLAAGQREDAAREADAALEIMRAHLSESHPRTVRAKQALENSGGRSART